MRNAKITVIETKAAFRALGLALCCLSLLSCVERSEEYTCLYRDYTNLILPRDKLGNLQPTFQLPKGPMTNVTGAGNNIAIHIESARPRDAAGDFYEYYRLELTPKQFASAMTAPVSLPPNKSIVVTPLKSTVPADYVFHTNAFSAYGNENPTTFSRKGDRLEAKFYFAPSFRTNSVAGRPASFSVSCKLRYDEFDVIAFNMNPEWERLSTVGKLEQEVNGNSKEKRK